MTGSVRLSKLMAARGLCSRREADEYIQRGQVMVDGQIVDTLGTKVTPDSSISLARVARRAQRERVTVLLNKPIGYVSGSPEGKYPAAAALLIPRNRDPADRCTLKFSRHHLQGLAPAGRLDIDSQGLLVLTQDGRIARHLIGPESRIEKEYLVRVEGAVDEQMLQHLRHGLVLDGKPLRPARVERLNADQLRFVLTEGRKRQIRRMCEVIELRVSGLKRVRIGRVLLGNLPEGKWRYLPPGLDF